MSYIAPADEPVIIFDSQWCRVRFQLEKAVEMHATTETLAVRYARLHTPNLENVMKWDGSDYWCWYKECDFLHFLDGRSPKYLVENEIYLSEGVTQYKLSQEAKSAEVLTLVEK